MNGFQEQLEQYFRSIRGQLLATALAGAPHSGLAGGHRESLIRDYLTDILPRRLEIGRGMVFGFMHRSREADVVLWDSNNYSCLRLTDHQLFFAESVRVVLEAKSQWSSEGFEDVLAKCRTVRDIIFFAAPNIRDEIDMLHLDIESLKTGQEHQGMLLSKPHIGTAGFFFRGGQTLTVDSVKAAWIDDADDSWPDALLLLEPGIVVTKHYLVEDGKGVIEFIQADEDCLLLFTAALMALVNERSVQIEDPTYLSLYVQTIREKKNRATLDFRFTRHPPSRKPLWG